MHICSHICIYACIYVPWPDAPPPSLKCTWGVDILSEGSGGSHKKALSIGETAAPNVTVPFACCLLF